MRNALHLTHERAECAIKYSSSLRNKRRLDDVWIKSLLRTSPLRSWRAHTLSRAQASRPKQNECDIAFTYPPPLPARRSVSSCVKRQFYRNAIPIALQLRTRATDPRGKGGAVQWHSPCAFTRSRVGTADKNRAEQVCAFSLGSLSLCVFLFRLWLWWTYMHMLVCNCGGWLHMRAYY